MSQLILTTFIDEQTICKIYRIHDSEFNKLEFQGPTGPLFLGIVVRTQGLASLTGPVEV